MAKSKKSTESNAISKKDSVDSITLESIEKSMQRLSIQEDLILSKYLESNDPDNIIKAQQYLQNLDKKKQDRNYKAYLFAPEKEFTTGLDFKSSLKTVTFDILRAMSHIPIVSAIIGTRVEQIQNFSKFTSDLQKEGWTIQKRLGRFENITDYKLKDKDKVTIDQIATFLEKGGMYSKWDNMDDLEEWLRKSTIDTLSLDQVTTELERDKQGKMYGYQAADAATIRLLDTIDEDERERYINQYEEINGYLPIYCQIWNGRILERKIGANLTEQVVWYPWEMSFGVRNRNSSIRNNGYGKSELEILREIITYILYSNQYNGNFFKQGSNPKGFFTIHGNINSGVLNEFKQAWRHTVSGVGNCLSGDSFILTDVGGMQIGSLFEDNDKDKFMKIWTGREFEEARAYVSGEKILNKMTLNNGMSVSSSPDHRFKVVSDSGVIEWKRREDIKLGDFVLVNKESVSIDGEIFYNGVKVDDDLFEVIGWILGDGWIADGKPKHRKMSTFYHSIKERWIAERHIDILSKYDINCYFKEHFYSQKEKDRLINKHGFKSIADSNIKVNIFDANFYKFLISLGFTTSKEGKRIPEIMYTLDSGYKRALLKGLFSADGSCDGRAIHLAISNDLLKYDVKQLLLSEGIRVCNHEGKERICNLSKKPTSGYRMLIKDNREYFNKIGFLQEHKQYKENKTGQHYIKESIPPSLVANTIKKIKIFQKEQYKEGIRIRNPYITNKISGIKTGKDVVSKDGLVSLCDQIGYQLPDDVLDFNFEKVISLEETDIKVPMYDIEVFNDEHQFIVNGIISHNSHKIPVFEGPDKIDWVDMQMKNKDMEFSNWNEFLILMACSVFRIDPSELGLNFKGQKQMFGQSGEKERLDFSKEKGLKPLLVFLQKLLNKYIVSEIDESFEFVFTGIDLEDEEKKVELDKKKLEAGVVSHGDMFEKYSGRPFDEENDVILNPVYQQAQQAKQFGGEESNAAIDEETGEPGEGVQNPFDEYEKGENPIMNAAIDYINKSFVDKE